MTYLGKGERVVDLMGQGSDTEMRRVTHRSVSILKQAGNHPTDTLRLCWGQTISSRLPICPSAHRHNDEVICKRHCPGFRIGVDFEVKRRPRGRFRMQGEFSYSYGR